MPIQKPFSWNSSDLEMKHETICKDFQYGGLKSGDIKYNKFTMLLDQK